MTFAIAMNVNAGKALVVGLGKTGYACVVFLVKRGFEVAVVDSREEPPFLGQLKIDFPGIAVYLGSFAAADGVDAGLLIVSPGVSWKEAFIQQAVQRGACVISDIELFARYANAPIIAVTGSNGKSTVTTLIGRMAENAGYVVAVGGNLGVPAVDLWSDPGPDYYVLELSSFQLDLTERLPTVAAVVLNISEDHMDRYESIEEYSASKARVYRYAETAVVNADDIYVSSMSTFDARLIRFTRHQPQALEFGRAARDGRTWLMYGKEYLVPTADLRLDGLHNQLNVLAALALGMAVGLPMAGMLSTAKQFAGLPHRCQLVLEINGVRWINDSKATNVGAAAAAIAGMDGKIILIAGGDAKEADFKSFRTAIEGKVICLILLGRDAEKLESVLRGAATIFRVATMLEAVQLAWQRAQPGETVLLAPACSSLDMYRNYEARGEDFVACVQQVIGGGYL